MTRNKIIHPEQLHMKRHMNTKLNSASNFWIKIRGDMSMAVSLSPTLEMILTDFKTTFSVIITLANL